MTHYVDPDGIYVGDLRPPADPVLPIWREVPTAPGDPVFDRWTGKAWNTAGRPVAVVTFHVDAAGVYVGAFVDGVDAGGDPPPAGAIEVPSPPADPADIWTGGQWDQSGRAGRRDRGQTVQGSAARHYADAAGRFVGSFADVDPAALPAGAIEVPDPPDDARDVWTGAAWDSAGRPAPDPVGDRYAGDAVFAALVDELAATGGETPSAVLDRMRARLGI